MVKFSIIVVAVLFSLSYAGATPAPSGPHLIQGNFEYQEHYEIQGQTHYELIYAISDSEKERMEHLKTEGYACIAKPSKQYVCSINIPVYQNDSRVAELAKKRFGHYAVSLDEALKVSPSIVSEDYLEWQVDQKVVITKTVNEESQSNTFKSISYAWNGFDKIYPGGNDNPDHDMFVVNGENLEIPWFLQMPGHTSWDSYVISVLLNRVP